MLRFFNRTGYIFTDKKNPKWGIMASILGVVSLVSICVAVYFTYLNKGMAPMQYGVVILLAIVYGIIGILLGIRSLMEKDIFRFFPIIGIVTNSLTMIAGAIVLYLGVV